MVFTPLTSASASQADMLSSDVPMQVQIYRQLKAEIVDGLWLGRDDFPGEKDLAERFGVSVAEAEHKRLPHDDADDDRDEMKNRVALNRKTHRFARHDVTPRNQQSKINWRYSGDRNAPKRVRSRPNEEERKSGETSAFLPCRSPRHNANRSS